MPMMGSAGTGADLYDLMETLNSNERYQSKVNELRQHTENAKKALEQAATNNRLAEEHKKQAKDMLAEAHDQVTVAQHLKEEADKAIKAAADREKALDAREAEQRQELEKHHHNLRGKLDQDFGQREAKVADRERQLAALMQEFEAKKAAFDTEKAEYARFKRAEDDAMKEATQALRNAREEVDGLIRTNKDLRAKLKEKLDKLKEITNS